MAPVAADLFCITKETIRFEKRDVSADHVRIPNPTPRPMNKEGLSEDCFILLLDGHTVLLEVASKAPYIVSRVDRGTPRGVEIYDYLCSIGGYVARLLKG